MGTLCWFAPLVLTGFIASSACAAGKAHEVAPATDLGRGLIVHYPFDKDASDASGKGHHGTNHGATLVAEGRLGGAFAFDGQDDYVSIPAKATEGLVRFTFALWVKTTQAEARPRPTFWQNPTLIGAATYGWGSCDVALMLENGSPACFHGLHGEGADMSWFSAARVSDGRWHHLALVNRGPRVQVLVNGRLVGGEGFWHHGEHTTPLGRLTQTASGAGLGDAPVFIGACNESGAKHLFRGLIDDVRIWSRALTAEELLALAALPADEPTADARH